MKGGWKALDRVAMSKPNDSRLTTLLSSTLQRFICVGTRDRRRISLIFVLTLFGLLGSLVCGSGEEVIAYSIDSKPLPIRFGDVVGGTYKGSVMIDCSGKGIGYGCSGTMLTNQWAISADHCFGDSAIASRCVIQYGGVRGKPEQVRSATRIVRHPTNTDLLNGLQKKGLQGVDLVLFKLDAPLEINGSTQGYRRKLLSGASSDLFGQSIECVGWGLRDDHGHWSHQLRKAMLTVNNVIIAQTETKTIHGHDHTIFVGDRAVYAANSLNQITKGGDSGCGCYLGEELAVINVGWSGKNGGFGVIMAEDSVQSWIELHVGGDLGLSSLSRPTAVTWGPGRRDVFWRGNNGELRHKWYQEGQRGWQPSEQGENLGGHLASAPSAAPRHGGWIDVYYRGADYRLKHKWYPYNGGWSWEQDLGGALLSGPSAAFSTNPDRLWAFYQNVQGGLTYRNYQVGTPHWSPHTNVSAAGQIGGPPAAVARYPYADTVHLFYAGAGGPGMGGYLFNLTYAGGRWSRVFTGFKLDSAPAASSRGTGRLDVYWRGADNKLKHVWYPYGNWWSWKQTLAEDVATVPAASAWVDNRLDVYWLSTRGKLKHIWYPYNDTWSSTQDLGQARDVCPLFQTSVEDLGLCTPGCPCNEGQGDCDTDVDCAGNLVCSKNVGGNYGLASYMDICEDPCPPLDTSRPGLWVGEFCTSTCPCRLGEGDCDEDEQCAAGYVCGQNVGEQYGLPKWADVCVATPRP